MEAVKRNFLAVDENLQLQKKANMNSKFKIGQVVCFKNYKRNPTEKEAYFIKFLEKFNEDCDEMESNFDRVKKEAYVKAETDPAIKDFLGRIFWDNLENNIESKVEFYKLIKQKL